MKWISVKEKMPEKGQRVITYDISFPDGGIIVEEYYGFEEWSTSYEVTHWMPLPDPPENA